MATGLGLSSWLGFADESVFGTYVPATKFLRCQKIGLKGDHTQKTKELLGQNSIVTSFKSIKKVSGPIDAPVPITGIEKILRHAFGTLADAGANPYTHTYTLALALPVGLSFHVNRDAASVGVGSAFKYFGNQISKLTLKQEIDDLLMATIDINGQDWGNLNVETPTFTAEAYFDYSNMTITVNAASQIVRGFEFTLDNNLATDRYQLGTRIVRGLGRNGPRHLSGKITKEFESLTEYQLFANLTAVAIVVTWTQAPHSLVLTLPKCYFRGEDPDLDAMGPIMTTMEFDCHQNAAANDEATLVLTNATPTGV